MMQRTAADERASDLAIGIDLGGTKIAAALVRRDGTLLAEQMLPTGAADGAEAVIARMADLATRLAAGRAIAGVGVGAPGPVIDGVALHAVNLGWHEVPLVARLGARLPDVGRIAAQNDVNAALIGEVVFGAARGCRDALLVAVGTGLGAAAISGGHLIGGAHGFALEIGHVSLDPAGRVCACGGRGCVETVISGKGLAAGARAYAAAYPRSLVGEEPVTGRAVIAAARKGDPLALRVLAEAAEALGTALAWGVMLLDPERIILGGGVIEAAGDLLLPRVEESLAARLIPDMRGRAPLLRTQVGSTAVGAAALVWHP